MDLVVPVERWALNLQIFIVDYLQFVERKPAHSKELRNWQEN
jgi:hypothetical protein